MTKEEMQKAIDEALRIMRVVEVFGGRPYEKIQQEELATNTGAMNFFKGVLRNQGMSGDKITELETFLIQEKDNEQR